MHEPWRDNLLWRSSLRQTNWVADRKVDSTKEKEITDLSQLGLVNSVWEGSLGSQIREIPHFKSSAIKIIIERLCKSFDFVLAMGQETRS